MTSRVKRILPVIFLAFSIIACNIPTAAGGSPTPQPTIFDLAATMTSEALTARPPTSTPGITPTEEEATGVPVVGITPVKPTKTSIPVVQITPLKPTATRTSSGGNNPGGNVPAGARRISFAPNATQSSISGTVEGGEMKEYVVRALAGQIMQVGLFTPDQNAVLSVYAPSTGQVFLSKTAGRTDWSGRLPVTTDYVLRATGTGGTASYTLTVTIMEKIQFQPGAISATRSYPIAPRDVHTFSLRALAGQTMTVKITSADGDVLLAIYGFDDGQPYKRYEVGEPSYSFELPATQDYVIQAVSVRDTATSFKMVVTVE